PSEVLRRILDDVIRQWTDRAWYNPEPAAEAEQQPSPEQVSIDLLPSSEGGVMIRFPRELSSAAQQTILDALGKHAREITPLVRATTKQEGPDRSQGRDQDGT